MHDILILLLEILQSRNLWCVYRHGCASGQVDRNPF